MIKNLLAVLLLIASPFAFADYPAKAQVTEYSTISNGTYYTDRNVACQNAVLTADEVYYSGGSLKYDTNRGYCVGVAVQGGVYTSSDAFRYLVSRMSSACPYGGTLNGGVCVGADAPPPPPPSCPTNIKAVYKWELPSATHPDVQKPPINGTDGVCAIKLTAVRDCFSRTDGTIVCYYDTVTTGGAAQVTSARPAPTATGDTGSATDMEKAAAADATVKRVNMPGISSDNGSCPAGSVQGGVDSSGIPICVGTGTVPLPPVKAPAVTTAPPVTIQNADGTTTTQTITTTKNADGSVTTTVDRVTANTDGSSTKAQDISTSSNTAGDPGTMSKPLPPSDLCSNNPQLAVCQNSSVAGQCATITCTGDAIQCATLRAAELMRCKGEKDSADLTGHANTALGAQITGGADPANAAIDAMKAGTTVDLSAPNLDQNGFVGSRACLAPRTISVMGKTVQMEFTSICNSIIPLRYAVMACASILAYLIVARSVVGA